MLRLVDLLTPPLRIIEMNPYKPPNILKLAVAYPPREFLLSQITVDTRSLRNLLIQLNADAMRGDILQHSFRPLRTLPRNADNIRT